MEINGAIVVACVMTLKPLIVKHFPGLLISRRGSSSSSSPSDTLGGPPTIGSRPSKAPVGFGDGELGGGKERGGYGYGYVEVGDEWGVDVEGVREKGEEGMVEKKGSVRSTESGSSTTILREREGGRGVEDEERGPPVPDKEWGGFDGLRVKGVGG